MNNDELKTIVGGVAISATMINALSRGITSLYNLGRALGTAIRMAASGRRC